jgi:membrane fusion protein, copper/silver efflux system
MKRKWMIYAFLLPLLLAGTACNTGQKDTKQQAVSPEEDIYTCSMHPQIREHHPGSCPICGMTLIKKNMGSTVPTPNNIQLEGLLKPTDQFVVASLPVTTPQQKPMNARVRAYGVIEYDTRATGTISARISGRIEKMYIRYRYQPVEKGQKIMDIYSPELLTAQENLLFLLKNDGGNLPFIQAAKERLSLLGMSEEQLQETIRTGKALYTVGIYSNYSGHIHDAGMTSDDVPTAGMNAPSPVTQELSLKEGMYIQKGQTLLMIMNHHKAWAALQIFANDQSLVNTGNAVTIIPETDTSAVIDGQIDLIEPFFRNNSKTLTARVYFHNMDMLPIGSHVSAEIDVNKQNALWLPQTAVLSLGMNNVAFIRTDGGFIAHKITTGLRSGNDIQVLSGLDAQDTVAVNAQYFIDSESFIKPSSK